MPGLELTEFVLLICDFHVLSEVPNGATSPTDESTESEDRVSQEGSEQTRAKGESGGEAQPEDTTDQESSEADWKTLDLHGATLSYSAGAEENELVLIVQLSLTDPTAPYELNLVTGSRFTAPTEPPVAVEEASRH